MTCQSEPDATAAILGLVAQAGALKRLPRTGWLHIGVPRPESVADHSYRVALLTLLAAAADPALNLARALTIALVHDLPEAIAGDSTPFDEALTEADVDRESLFRSRPAYSAAAADAKRRAEEAALEQLSAGLPGPLAALLRAAWQDYESGTCAEARLVRQVDKLEALLQALEYRGEQPELPIASFEIGTRAAVDDPALRALLDAMVARFGQTGADEGTGEREGRQVL